jgi:hypothetical protein
MDCGCNTSLLLVAPGFSSVAEKRDLVLSLYALATTTLPRTATCCGDHNLCGQLGRLQAHAGTGGQVPHATNRLWWRGANAAQRDSDNIAVNWNDASLGGLYAAADAAAIPNTAANRRAGRDGVIFN